MRMWIAGWVIGAILGIALSPLNAVAGPSGNPDPLFGPQDFFGSLAGWGFPSGRISQPGPTITVSQFEVVTLNLFAADASTHSWLLDLNLDGGFNPGENLSGNFPPEPEVFTFVPTAPPGAYQYICGIHGVSMSGQFEILPATPPPTAPGTITCSEPINTRGPGSVTFTPSAAPLTPNWNSPGNTVLTVSHPPLLRATRYSVTVSDFLDRSNPGNPMLQSTFSFTTANDPPAIAVTQPTGISRWSGGSTHDIQWDDGHGRP